jgi:endonuclease III related protein
LGWWPGRTRFEIAVGAILTQNTSWKNVEKAIEALRERGWLSPRSLASIPASRLAPVIRSSGYFRQKARKLRTFLDHLETRHGGRLERMARVPTGRLREDLLSIWGIGPETADSILLYAFDRPIFVVDAYTHRVLRRHALHPGGGYEAVRAYLEGHLLDRTDLYNDFHAQFVWVGHRFCGTKPRCEECPLKHLLPEGRPRSDAGPARGRTRWQARCSQVAAGLAVRVVAERNP